MNNSSQPLDIANTSEMKVSPHPYLYQITKLDGGTEIFFVPNILCYEENTNANISTFILKRDICITFFRAILQFIREIGLSDYHLRIHPPPFKAPSKYPYFEQPSDTILKYANRIGFMVSCTNDGKERKKPVDAPQLFDLNRPIILKTETCSIKSSVTSYQLIVARDDKTNFICALDASGRSVLVIVPPSFVSCLDDLDDNNMYSALTLTANALEKFTKNTYDAIIINVGKYMNVSHLHIKIYIPKQTFDDTFDKHKYLLQLRKDVTWNSKSVN